MKSACSHGGEQMALTTPELRLREAPTKRLLTTQLTVRRNFQTRFRLVAVAKGEGFNLESAP